MKHKYIYYSSDKSHCKTVVCRKKTWKFVFMGNFYMMKPDFQCNGFLAALLIQRHVRYQGERRGGDS